MGEGRAAGCAGTHAPSAVPQPPCPAARFPAAQVYAIRQALAKAVVAYYQKFVDEASKKEVKVRRTAFRPNPVALTRMRTELGCSWTQGACAPSPSRLRCRRRLPTRRHFFAAFSPLPPPIQDILLAYDRTLLVADPRHREAKKFGGNARGKVQKSYR